MTSWIYPRGTNQREDGAHSQVFQLFPSINALTSFEESFSRPDPDMMEDVQRQYPQAQYQNQAPYGTTHTQAYSGYPSSHGSSYQSGTDYTNLGSPRQPSQPFYGTNNSYSSFSPQGPYSAGSNLVMDPPNYPSSNVSYGAQNQPSLYPVQISQDSYLPQNQVTSGGTRHDSPGYTNDDQVCPYDGCSYTTERPFDLDRHLQKHLSSETKWYDCPGRGCGRTGEHGFKRKDHLTEHLRKVHAQSPKASGDGKRRT